MVIVEGSGANAIAVDAGANMDIDQAQVDGALAGVDKGSVLLLQLEIPVALANTAIRAGKRRGLTVMLNPAPPTTRRNLDTARVDVLTPNEVEFSRLTGTSNLRRGTSTLLDAGVGTVVVTLGRRGAFVRTREESYSLTPPKVRAVDTTGAGDAFNGAFAVALSEGKGIRESVEFANAAGALTVTKREVIAALPSRRAVDGLLRKPSG